MHAVSGWAWVHLFAAASGLVVTALAVARGGTSRLTLPLALLGVDQLAFNIAALGGALNGDRNSWVGAVAAPWFPALAFDFVVTFLGRRGALRRWVRVIYGVFAAESVASLLALLWPTVASMQTLSLVLMITSAPLAAAALFMVTRHLRQAGAELERWRTWALLLAISLVTVLLTTDLLADLGFPVPRLATLGSFGFNLVMSALTVRMGLFEQRDGRATAFLQALLAALFVAVTYLVVFLTMGERRGALVATMLGLTMALGVAGWVVFRSSLAARAGLERFATLGRFSAQMAHDLKNPLAAARGAAEFLAEEMRRAGQAEHHDFSQLIVQQLDRLSTVIDRYQRLSKLEPERRTVDVNALVRKVLSLQAFAGHQGVTVVERLPEVPLHWSLDADLLASALENLVKNAFEAMPSGGRLTVTTGLDEGQLALSVEDTGHGMDARAREQAFELFFTTKASGSGLGLAFVQQVARAHGGEVRLSSREGSGTLVQLTLPTEEDVKHG